jgi:hypothetical protein
LGKSFGKSLVTVALGRTSNGNPNSNNSSNSLTRRQLTVPF